MEDGQYLGRRPGACRGGFIPVHRHAGRALSAGGLIPWLRPGSRLKAAEGRFQTGNMVIPVTFDSSGSQLRGWFFPSSGYLNLATVLFLQGFPGTEGDELLCERLAQENVSVLTFNYRGTFRSEGWFSFSNAVSDIGAALRFVKEPGRLKKHQINPEKIVLGGWSFGSGLLPAGAVQHPDFSRIFAISGRDFGKEALKIEKDHEYAKEVMRNLESVRAPKGPVAFRDDILSDLVKNRASFDIEKLAPLLKERDILLIGGWNDSVVAIEDHLLPFYRLLLEKGAKKARIEALPDDHDFSETRNQLVHLIVNWLREEEIGKQ
jgi:pimeloyl-ACP methyl ester carboxylesterase